MSDARRPSAHDPADVPLSEREREIQQRVEKASPGPWRSEPMYDGGSTVAMMRDWRVTRGCAASVQGPDGWIHQVPETAPDANAEFIAHAREDIPYLLAELDALRSQLKEREQHIAEAVYQAPLTAGERTTESYYQPVPVKGDPTRPAYTLAMAQLEESRDQWQSRAEELREHERHEKETVADAGQAYAKWARRELEALRATLHAAEQQLAKWRECAAGASEETPEGWATLTRDMSFQLEDAEQQQDRLTAIAQKWLNRAESGFDPEETDETTAYWNGVRAVVAELLAPPSQETP